MSKYESNLFWNPRDKIDEKNIERTIYAFESLFLQYNTRTRNVIGAYRRNNRRVREEIPAGRLLVFEVAQGWDPLCRFLGVPVPASDFPRSNHRDEFWAHFGGEPDSA